MWKGSIELRIEMRWIATSIYQATFLLLCWFLKLYSHFKTSLPRVEFPRTFNGFNNCLKEWIFLQLVNFMSNVKFKGLLWIANCFLFYLRLTNLNNVAHIPLYEKVPVELSELRCDELQHQSTIRLLREVEHQPPAPPPTYEEATGRAFIWFCFISYLE